MQKTESRFPKNNMEHVKLIWDFSDPNAAPTASHHVIHLKEFAQIERLQNTLCNVEEISETHHIAYLVVEKVMMNELRERLKPHRGHTYQP